MVSGSLQMEEFSVRRGQSPIRPEKAHRGVWGEQPVSGVGFQGVGFGIWVQVLDKVLGVGLHPKYMTSVFF